VTLLVGLIGIYTQVLGLQTARMFSHQSGLAKEMLTWHAAAVSMAASIIRTNYTGPTGYAAIATTGCSLTYTPPPPMTAVNRCPTPQYMGPVVPGGQKGGIAAGPLVPLSGTVTSGAPPGTVTVNLVNAYDSNASLYYTECVHLPATCNSVSAAGNCGSCITTYDTTNGQFFSVLYQPSSGGPDYVVTFVPSVTPTTTNPTGLLSLANGNQIGLNTSDLMQQLRHTGIPNFTFGTVNASNQLVTVGMQFILPPNGVVPANAVAMISSPDGF